MPRAPVLHPALLAAAAVLSACGGSTDGDTTTPTVLDPPPMALHRLNRLEYDNTVRDLIGTTLQPARAFPPDSATDGFDNQAESLALTSALFDQYFLAARQVVDEALTPVPEYEGTFAGEGVGLHEDQRLGDTWSLLDDDVVLQVEVPAGRYDLVLRAGGSQIGDTERSELQLTVDGAPIDTFTVEGSAAQLVPHTTSVDLAAGLHVIRYHQTNYVNSGFSNTSNVITVQSLTVVSETRLDGPGRSLVFVCDPADPPDPATDDPCPHDIVHAFAARAFRRPLTVDEQATLSALYDVLREGEESVEDAIRLALRAVLVSPKFLYRAHHAQPGDERWAGYERASRLSYVLWASMPDERLFALADDGSLDTPEGLADAARWMLADDKAEGFVDGFVEPWLAVRELASAAPSPEVFPTFDEAVREAMVEETRRFVGDYLTNGLPVVDMLAPSFGYRNDALADHYQVSRVGSDEMRRIPLGPTDRRGILALGAWLVAKSHSDRSSPIYRGAWLAENVLCQPVPPPPAGLQIPELEISEQDLTVREALERHRGDPACAGCHTYLDVVGIGFEEFDGAGVQRQDPTLDTLGELPGGPTFEGAAGFAAAVDPQDFLRCVNRKLFTYGLGRAPLDEEEPLLDAEIDPRATLPDLVARLVASPQFKPGGN